MTAYVIFDVPPTSDRQREAMKPYGEKAWDTLKPYGGIPIVRTNEIEVREVNPQKSWTPERLLIIEFPTLAVSGGPSNQVKSQRAGQHAYRERD